MMSVLFAAMVGFSLVCALFQGHLPDLTQALLTGGSEAVTLLLRLARRTLSLVGCDGRWLCRAA